MPRVAAHHHALNRAAPAQGKVDRYQQRQVEPDVAPHYAWKPDLQHQRSQRNERVNQQGKAANLQIAAQACAQSTHGYGFLPGEAGRPGFGSTFVRVSEPA